MTDVIGLIFWVVIISIIIDYILFRFWHFLAHSELWFNEKRERKEAYRKNRRIEREEDLGDLYKELDKSRGIEEIED